MKNIYSITISLLLLVSLSVFGQVRIYTPTLNEPENGALDQVPDVLLNWSAVTGDSLVILYEAQLSLTEDFADPITFPKTDVTSENMSNLIFGETYYWRVRAYDGQEVSDWSEIWSFSILNTIALHMPLDNSMVYANPVLDWDAVSGLTGYELQLDTVYDWHAVDPETEENLNTAFIVDDNNKWLAGDNGLIMYYDGTDWSTVESGVTENIKDLWFTGAANGYAVGEGGTVLHYDGAVWSVVDAGTTEDLDAVSFVDENTGWAVGAGGITLKYDSGTWSEETTSNTIDLRDVYALSADNVWVCGLSKTIGHYDGTDWTYETVSNRDLYSIWFVDANNGWAVGKSGKVVYYNGEEWIVQASGVNKDLLSVNFSGTTGYAVGKNGKFITYNGYWSPLTSGTGEEMRSVFVSGDEGAIVGVDGMLMEKSGGIFNSPDLKTYQIDADSMQKSLHQLLFGTDYYYRIRGMHEEDTSMWSGARKMTTYATTTLSAPSDGSEGTHLRINFEWSEYDGITNYILEVDSNENFTLPRTFGPDLNHQVVNDLVFGTDYFWRVKVQHFEDLSDWSEVWTFTTTNTIVLESPENGATNVLQCPRYAWEKVEGASRYILWVDSDINFSDPLTVVSDSAYFQCQSALEKQTVYYWKVRGQAGASVSNWSEVWSFETEGYDGIDENFENNVMQVYPNPNNGVFTLGINSLTNTTCHVRIVDLVGKELYQKDINCSAGENFEKLNLQHLENGIYLIHLQQEGRSVTKKLFIK